MDGTKYYWIFSLSSTYKPSNYRLLFNYLINNYLIIELSILTKTTSKYHTLYFTTINPNCSLAKYWVVQNKTQKYQALIKYFERESFFYFKPICCHYTTYSKTSPLLLHYPTLARDPYSPSSSYQHMIISHWWTSSLVRNSTNRPDTTHWV